LCPLFSLLLRCSCFLGARGFMRLSQITLTDRFVHTDTRGLNKRVLLNMLSSVSILLSAFLRSAFHRHFIFLLQTPADRRSFFSVSAFSWSVFSLPKWSEECAMQKKRGSLVIVRGKYYAPNVLGFPAGLCSDRALCTTICKARARRSRPAECSADTGMMGRLEAAFRSASACVCVCVFPKLS
jgi:hypothetical protein